MSPAKTRPGVSTATLLQGKQLSYNNINDTDAAYELVAEFLAGTGSGLRDHQACQPLWRRDRPSLRRGLQTGAGLRPGVGLRRHHRAEPQLDAATAEEIVKLFTEVIIAPDADDEAKAIIAARRIFACFRRRPARPARIRPDLRRPSPAACWCRRATMRSSTISS